MDKSLLPSSMQPESVAMGLGDLPLKTCILHAETDVKVDDTYVDHLRDSERLQALPEYEMGNLTAFFHSYL